MGHTEHFWERQDGMPGRRAEPDEPYCCPVCGTALGDGDAQYLDTHGTPVGCETCVTVRWH